MAKKSNTSSPDVVLKKQQKYSRLSYKFSIIAFVRLLCYANLVDEFLCYKKSTRHQPRCQGLSPETPWQRGRYYKADTDSFFRDAFGLCIFSEMVLRARQQTITSCLHSRRDKRAGLVNISSTRREAVVLTVATQHVVLKLENTQF